MKKLLAFILCLTMAMGTVAFAEEVTGTELNKDVLEGQTTVSLTIRPEDNEFVVVIPATVEIDPETSLGKADIVLKAGWKIPSANSLHVHLVNAKNGIEKTVDGRARFYLKDEADNEHYYSIRRTTSGFPLEYHEEGYRLLSVYKNGDSTRDAATSLEFRVTNLPQAPGVYTDVLTFAVVIE